jgi:hypothetical protein
VISAAAFRAPPPIFADGRLIVPPHIKDLTARGVSDGSKQAATADATMTYIVGPTAGSPFFALRQTVDRCWLDGHDMDSAVVSSRVVEGPSGTVRVIDVAQRARSVHRLRIRYRLDIPFAGLGDAYPPKLTWAQGPRLRWSIAVSDLNPGRYLEAWFPSNLPFDHFRFVLDLRLMRVPILYTLITNGEVVAAQREGWSVRFSPWLTTMSPLVEMRAEHQPPNGGPAIKRCSPNTVSDRPVLSGSRMQASGFGLDQREPPNRTRCVRSCAAGVPQREHGRLRVAHGGNRRSRTRCKEAIDRGLAVDPEGTCAKCPPSATARRAEASVLAGVWK